MGGGAFLCLFPETPKHKNGAGENSSQPALPGDRISVETVVAAVRDPFKGSVDGWLSWF